MANAMSDDVVDLRKRRSRRARRLAKILIPVLSLSVSAALWAEPEIAAKLREGQAHMANLVAAFTSNETEAEATQASVVETAEPSHMPQSRVRIRRGTE